MAKKSKADSSPPKQPSRIENQIWGILYLAIGFLILIALASHLTGAADNVLGHLGTYLARGLIKLFGAVAAFFVPAITFYVGISLFQEMGVRSRTLLFSVLVGVQICILFAIADLPRMGAAETFSPNILGHAVAYLLYKPFGPHRFGPYFLFSLSLLITLALAFQIDLRLWVKRIWQALSAGAGAIAGIATKAWRRAVGAMKSIRAAKASSADSQKSRQTKAKEPDAGAETESPATPAVQSEEAAQADLSKSEEESQARSPLEEELAAFRARLHEPVKISTLDNAPPFIQENDEEEEESEEADIAEGGLLDPTLIDEQYQGMCNIPSAVTPAVKRKKARKPYHAPSPDVIPDPPTVACEINRDAIENNSRTLVKTLMNFGVEGKVVNVNPGPVVTQYEIELAPGVKISKIINLQDDLAMAVGGKKIRIEAPIPGKAAVGVELPNEEMQIVNFKHIMLSDAFRKSKADLPVIIGKSISGASYVTNICKMPHLLIAGQTGSGKSVCINSLICSLLMTKKPDELRLILIDPKKVELSIYEGIPHLMAPVVTESKEAVKALQWGVNEMTRRYRMLAKVHARNIESFNKKVREKSIKEGALSEEDNKILPFIVILVDELADLMMTASRDVEALIQRIAQLARAVGIHLIVATQRPSVDIITGPIKANLTSRIAFRTIQSTDSRTILGHVGAEKLLGRGDMLFLRNGAPEIERYHGAFISEEDVERVVSAIRVQAVEMEDTLESFDEAMGGGDSGGGDGAGSPGGASERDERFEEAARLIVSVGQGSTSLLQRRLKLGYARAGRLMDDLHAAGIVGPQEGSKMRDVLIKPDELELWLARLNEM